MGSLLARISDKTTGSQGNFGNVFKQLIADICEKYKGKDHEIDNRIRSISVVRYRISQMENDFKNQMMILCAGSISEVNELKRSSVSQYLAKFENYVSQIEAMNKK